MAVFRDVDVILREKIGKKRLAFLSIDPESERYLVDVEFRKLQLFQGDSNP